MKRAIVLSGGGARGSYQIGAWKALRRLNIKYDIVTGTSVGSLNGALMAQNTYFKGLWFWYNIKIKYIFKDEIMNDCTANDGRRSIFKKYIKAIFLNHGMDVSSLQNTINKAINEEKIRKSKINFGIVTFNLSNFKPIILTKNDIPKGKLKDYLMASATCFPAFKKKNIDDVNYIDGGYYDNLPINLAIQMGAEEIIAIDLKAIGLKRRVINKNVKITHIAPRNNLGFFLLFHKNAARRGMRLGYNDTMKTFNKLDGNKFTFKHKHLNRNFRHYNFVFIRKLNDVLKKDKSNIIDKLLKVTSYKDEISENDFNDIIEYLGKVFQFDDSYIYNIDYFNKKLTLQFDQISSIDKSLIEQKIKNVDLRGLLNTKNVIKYIYDKILITDNEKVKKELASIALFFPKEFLGTLYIYVLKNKK
jgi:NTE family protein